MRDVTPQRPELYSTSEGESKHRHRRFHVASAAVSRNSVEQALDRPNVARYVGIIHDKDPGVAAHGHVVFELVEARSTRMVASMLGVDLACVHPLIGQRGDRYSFSRAVRGLTHETARAKAEGKHRYADEEVFASAGYNWRIEVDLLDSREAGGPSLLSQLKLQVLLGERTARSILEELPELYIEHHDEFEKLDQRFLRERATPAQRALRTAEARRRARGDV
jgi:hypothetical protein